VQGGAHPGSTDLSTGDVHGAISPNSQMPMNSVLHHGTSSDHIPMVLYNPYPPLSASSAHPYSASPTPAQGTALDPLNPTPLEDGSPYHHSRFRWGEVGRGVRSGVCKMVENGHWPLALRAVRHCNGRYGSGSPLGRRRVGQWARQAQVIV
jgi:hypothetical protein